MAKSLGLVVFPSKGHVWPEMLHLPRFCNWLDLAMCLLSKPSAVVMWQLHTLVMWLPHTKIMRWVVVVKLCHGLYFGYVMTVYEACDSIFLRWLYSLND